MSVKNYAHQYTLQIKNVGNEREDYSFSDSSNESEDLFPLIRQNLDRHKMRDSVQLQGNRINSSSIIKVSSFFVRFDFSWKIADKSKQRHFLLIKL